MLNSPRSGACLEKYPGCWTIYTVLLWYCLTTGVGASNHSIAIDVYQAAEKKIIQRYNSQAEDISCGKCSPEARRQIYEIYSIEQYNLAYITAICAEKVVLENSRPSDIVECLDPPMQNWNAFRDYFAGNTNGEQSLIGFWQSHESCDKATRLTQEEKIFPPYEGLKAHGGVPRLYDFGKLMKCIQNEAGN